MKITVTPEDRETLDFVARTSLRTKLQESLADQLTSIVTEAVLAIRKNDEPIDLHMVRIVDLQEHIFIPNLNSQCQKAPIFCLTTAKVSGSPPPVLFSSMKNIFS